MSDFKVGDKVRRIGDNCAGTVTGGIYTVKGFRHTNTTIMLLEFPEDVLGWSVSKFELVPQVNKFKVGDTVRCINSGGYPITLGKVYTVQAVAGEFLHVIDDEGTSGGYRHIRFELVRDHVLTPEEVFKHLQLCTKLQFAVGSKWCDHSGNTGATKVSELISTKWRIKPVPKIIEANGRKYKLIEE